MKPFVHAGVSVRKFGGATNDYIQIHDMLDISKSASADMRHRMLFHHSLGPYIMEKIFGTNITNSDGKEVSVRDIAEQHILDDMGGKIPSFDQWQYDPVDGSTNHHKENIYITGTSKWTYRI